MAIKTTHNGPFTKCLIHEAGFVVGVIVTSRISSGSGLPFSWWHVKSWDSYTTIQTLK